MIKPIKYFLSLAAILLLTLPGCIEITEEIRVNADGSGTAKWGTDIGAIGASVNNDNSQIDLSLLEKIREIPRQAKEILAKVEGIQNVQAVSDDKKGIYSVSFEFSNSKALNNAIYSLAGVKKTAFTPALIKIKKHRIIKKDLAPYLKKAFKNQEEKKVNDMFYSMIYFRSTVVLPSDVKKTSNIKSRQPDSRTVVTKFSLDEMLKGGFDFGNVIRY